jgi:hypothetical protein
MRVDDTADVFGHSAKAYTRHKLGLVLGDSTSPLKTGQLVQSLKDLFIIAGGLCTIAVGRIESRKDIVVEISGRPQSWNDMDEGSPRRSLP